MTAFYWVFFVGIVLVLAYASLFNLTPLVFLIAGGVLGFGYLAFLSYRKRQSGVWEHSKYQQRFVGSVFLLVIIFWTTVVLFSNIKEPREFWARYEPYISEGKQRGYTFYYLDHANSYERIDSPALNKYIEDRNPGKVKLVLEIVRDFGRLRAYSVKSVDAIAVNKEWIDGEPPWSVLRVKQAK